jgi:hypothetical protein
MYLLPAAILAINLPTKWRYRLADDFLAEDALAITPSPWGVTPPKPPPAE